ncbi:MAG: DUF3293 domain-containing protein [Candidatus Sericytochromatia bacterium]
MREDQAFLVPELPLYTAAMLGISKERWTAAKDDWSLEQVAYTMGHRGFDVLPIQDAQGQVCGYYQTQTPGHYSAAGIQRHEPKPENSLYYLTTLEDLVRLFYQAPETFFYFLSNQQGILGMVSRAHLNSRMVYLYIFNECVRLEKDLAQWLTTAYSNQELVQLVEEICTVSKKHLLKRSWGRYQSDEKDVKDNALIEYFYLTDLLTLIKDLGWLPILNLDENKFSELYDCLKDVRNAVAHPVKGQIELKDAHHFFLALRNLEQRIEDLQLFAHYFKTDYQVFEPALTIGVSHEHPELDAFLRQYQSETWCFITGANPQSRLLSSHENQQQYEKLKDFLHAQSYLFFEGQGQSRQGNWPPEASFLVLGVSREDAICWGQKFEQKAVVFGVLGEQAQLVPCYSDQLNQALKIPLIASKG